MDKAEQEDLYRRIGLGQREVGGDPTSLAVLVVDFQRLFTEGELATPRTADALAATATLLERARNDAVPAFFVHVVYDEPSDAGPVWSAKSPAMASALRGTPFVEIDPRVEPRSDERVIEKKRASAFFGTSLHEELGELGVTTLLLTGTSTSGCVRASVVDASGLDYRPLVVRECVDDRAELSSEIALFDIASKYGDVVSLEGALTLLDEAASVAP